MITMKETKCALLTLSAKGSATAADNLDAEIVPFDGFIDALLVQCGVIGVDGTGAPTQDMTVDIKKNGTSVVDATKITFTHTALLIGPSSYGSIVGLAPIAVLKGDVISLQIVQILNGTSPTQAVNLSAAVRVSRARGGGVPAQVITGSVSEI